jgi:hypothetical protein
VQGVKAADGVFAGAWGTKDGSALGIQGLQRNQG